MQAVGGFPEAAGGDLLLGQRLAQRGLRARHLPDYLVSCAHALPAPGSLRAAGASQHSVQAVRGLQSTCMTRRPGGRLGPDGMRYLGFLALPWCAQEACASGQGALC